MKETLIFPTLLLITICSYSQSFWKIENEYGDQILLSVVLDEGKKTFEAYTRKDALKDIAGNLTYTLAKSTGKLKYPEIVFIKGQTHGRPDSLHLTGDFFYFDKHFGFEAFISDDHFNGKYFDNKNKAHLLNGYKVHNSQPIKDYPSIINKAISLTEKYLVNSKWLKSDEWLNFRQKIDELKPVISDDYEIAASFYWLGKSLPFSPYEISKINPYSKSSGRNKSKSIRELKSNTAAIDANNLPVTTREMDSIASIIDKKRYTNLIIDLRGKTKIFPEATEILMSYLSADSFFAGVYLTRKWFDAHQIIPDVRDYTKFFRSLSDNSYSTGGIYKESGRYLQIVPNGRTYKGKVFVLADSRTSGASETLIYILQSQKIATIVGQKTSGSSVLYEKLTIDSEYSLNLSVSYFYTLEGKILNKNGIEPDIALSDEDALHYVLKTL